MKSRSHLLLLISLLWAGLASGQVVINEIMYNSDGPDVEFVELNNAS